MEIILYQASASARPSRDGPSLIEKESLISERRMAGWAGDVRFLFRCLVSRKEDGRLGRPTVFLSETKKFVRAKTFLVLVGNGLILASLVGIFLAFGPLVKLELNYRQKKEENLQAKVQTHFGDLAFQGVALEAQSIEVPDVNFSLVIPKINASSVIIPNVNAANEKEYDVALKRGVAHAAGTVFPGMKGTIFLFAHSTDAPWNIRRYNAVFYLLRELEENDRIIVYYQGVKFYYSVSEKKIVDPSETYWFNQQEEEVLVLQTCYPPGTIQKALLIFAKPV